MCGLHIACMQPSGAAAWLYMCAAVSGQRARWGARISCELAPWPRHAQTTTLHGDATEFYYRPSDPQGRLSAPTYPITDGVPVREKRQTSNVVKTEIANPVSLRRQGSA